MFKPAKVKMPKVQAVKMPKMSNPMLGGLGVKPAKKKSAPKKPKMCKDMD